MDALAASSSEVWPGASPTPEVARPVIAVDPRGKVPPIKASSNRIEHENRRLVFLRHARLHLHADPNVFGSHAFDMGVLVKARREQIRSEEHTSELQSLMRNSYAVFCLKKKNKINHT